MILLPILLTAGSTISGDMAAERTKKMLSLFDVAGPLTVKSIGKIGQPSGPQSWSIAISARNGHTYQAYFRLDDRIWALERDDSRSAAAQARPSASELAITDQWLARLKPAYASRPIPTDRYAWGRRNEILVGGYPFVSGQYGYDFTILKGEFAAYGARDTVPPVGSAVVSITRTEALRRATTIFHRFDQPGGLTYSPIEVLGLAWLEVGGPKAILVWRVLGHPKILGGEWTKSPSAFEIFIDAATGAEQKFKPTPN